MMAYRSALMSTDFIREQLKNASTIALRHFGVSRALQEDKGDPNQVVTAADHEIGETVVQAILQKYPDHNIIDEEAGVIDVGSAFTWVIDPIDGTSNFAVGVSQFGILLGLLEEDTPVAAGLAVPTTGEIVTAERDMGAWSAGERLQVNLDLRLENAVIAYLIDSHREDPERTYAEARLWADIVLASQNMRTSGSMIDALLLCKGAYGGVLNQTGKIWDNVALHLIVEEAGGVYTDIVGQPIRYANATRRASENFTTCAATPAIHDELQQIIAKAGQKPAR